MTYVVVTIMYFLLIGFLLWKNEAGTYIRHMTPHHLVCILKTSFSILTEVVLTMSLTFACVYTLCGLRKALPDEKEILLPCRMESDEEEVRDRDDHVLHSLMTSRITVLDLEGFERF